MIPANLEQARTAIVGACAAMDNKGDAFERLTTDLVNELGFYQVFRQHSGTQFGHDIVARLDDSGGAPTRWLFECKNLGRNVRPSDIAEKLIWHLTERPLTGGFVIVSPLPLSNELRELLGRELFRFPVLDWSADTLIHAVLACPTTCAKWFPAVTARLTDEECRQARVRLTDPEHSGFRAAASLRVRTSFFNDPPRERAYFLTDGHLVEADGAVQWILRVNCFNAGHTTLFIDRISVTTRSYEPLPKRLLVERKAKGEYRPLFLSFAADSRVGASQELLAPRIRQLTPSETETIDIGLNGGPSGVYRLEVSIAFDTDGERHERVITTQTVCIYSGADMTADPDNRMGVFVSRKFLPVVARAILEKPEAVWRQVNGRMDQDGIVFAGPSMWDDIKGKRPPPWVVQRLPLVDRTETTDGGGAHVSDEAELLLDLGDIQGEHLPTDVHRAMAKSIELYGRVRSIYEAGPPPDVHDED